MVTGKRTFLMSKELTFDLFIHFVIENNQKWFSEIDCFYVDDYLNNQILAIFNHTIQKTCNLTRFSHNGPFFFALELLRV
jgi:hypothetical protein